MPVKNPVKLDKACSKIRKTRGLSVKVAAACRISRMAVYQWTRVPVGQVHVVAPLIEMTPQQIRPDVFKPYRSQ